MAEQDVTNSRPPIWKWQGWMWLAQGSLLAALAWSVHASFGWQDVLAAALATPSTAWIAGLLGLLVSYGLRAYRLQLFMKDQGATVISALDVSAKHNLLCVTVPMRAGEAALPLLLRARFGLPYRNGIGTLIALRLLDVYALVACVLLFMRPLGGQTLWVLAAWLVTPGVLRLPRVAGALRRASATAYIVNALLARPGLFVCSLALWTLKLAGFAAFLALACEVGFGTGMFGALGGELASVLPVQGPAGVGTYEAGIVGGLAFANATGASVVGAAVSLHALVIGVAVLMAPSAAWMARSARP